MYAIKSDSTALSYSLPMTYGSTILGTLKNGYLFTAKGSGVNQYEGVPPFIRWYLIDGLKVFVRDKDVVYVGPVQETTYQAHQIMPAYVRPGQVSALLEGEFRTNWQINGSLFYLTKDNEYPTIKNFPTKNPGLYAYNQFLPADMLDRLPAGDSVYEVDVQVTVVAPGWPYPEETHQVLEAVTFTVYNPANSIHFTNGTVTVKPGQTFANPVVMLPLEATLEENYEIFVSNPDIVEFTGHSPATFRALKEGTTIIHVQTTDPHPQYMDSFNLEVSASASAAILRGDANADGAVDITDLVSIISYILDASAVPPSLENADANADGTVDITDLVWIINLLL